MSDLVHRAPFSEFRLWEKNKGRAIQKVGPPFSGFRIICVIAYWELD